jgi:hypothetical protein
MYAFSASSGGKFGEILEESCGENAEEGGMQLQTCCIKVEYSCRHAGGGWSTAAVMLDTGGVQLRSC